MRYTYLFTLGMIAFGILFSCKQNDPTPANAGADTLVYDTTAIHLYANSPVYGEGKWRIIEGRNGEIIDSENPNAKFIGKKNTSYQLIWSIENSVGFSNDKVEVRFINAVAHAGEDAVIFDDTTYQLQAVKPPEGSGRWSIVSGNGGVIHDPKSPNTIFAGQYDSSYVLRWTVSQPSQGDTAMESDEVKIAFKLDTLYPDAMAGPDTVVFDTNTNLEGNVPDMGSGKWDIIEGDGGKIVDSANPHTEFQGLLDTNYTLRWTVTNKYGTAEDQVSITFSSPVIAGADTNLNMDVGDGSIQLKGKAPPPRGGGKWSLLQGKKLALNETTANTEFFPDWDNIEVQDSVVFLLEWEVWNFNKTVSDADTTRIVAKN